MNGQGEREQAADIPAVSAVQPEGRVLSRIEVDVPPGWELLPSGTVRKLRANTGFLSYGGNRPPFAYEENGITFNVFEVRVLGTVHMRSEEYKGGCGTAGRVWAETDGPILIRKA